MTSPEVLREKFPHPRVWAGARKLIFVYHQYAFKHLLKRTSGGEANGRYLLSKWIKVGDKLIFGELPIGAPHLAFLLEMVRTQHTDQLLFFGTCGSLGGAALNSLIMPQEVICLDGVSRHYRDFHVAKRSDSSAVTSLAATRFENVPDGEGPKDQFAIRSYATESGLAAIERALFTVKVPSSVGLGASVDAFFCETETLLSALRSVGAMALDMETGAGFYLAQIFNLQVAGLWVVSDGWIDGQWRLASAADGELVAEQLAQVIAAV